MTNVIVYYWDYRRGKCKNIYNLIEKEIFARWKM